MTTPTGSDVAKALIKVQAELKPIPRTRKGQAGTRKHKYADLADVEEAVFPLLNRAGLAWITKPTTTADGRFVLYYAMVHAATGDGKTASTRCTAAAPPSSKAPRSPTPAGTASVRSPGLWPKVKTTTAPRPPKPGVPQAAPGHRNAPPRR